MTGAHYGADVTAHAYLDAAGAARPDNDALTGLTRALATTWGRPAAPHDAGRRARAAFDAARQSIAAHFDVTATEVIFTSSHVQALHLGVRAAAAARARTGRRIVTSAVERTTLLHAAAFAGDCDLVPVDEVGHVDVDAFARALGSGDVALAALQAANGETGTVQPLADVHAVAREHQVPLLVDAASACGAIPLALDGDIFALDAGEWGAPIRLGVLIARTAVRLRPQWPEDADAWFPGGVDPAAAFAAAVALDGALRRLETSAVRRHALVEHVRTAAASYDGVRPVGDPVDRLPHVITLAIDDVVGEVLAGELDRRGVSVGTGSACSSSSIEPSHVLRAMGVSFDGNIRLTLDEQASVEEVELFLAQLPEALDAARHGGRSR